MHLMLEYTPRAIVLAGGQKIADTAASVVLTDRAGDRGSQSEGDLPLSPGEHGGHPGWDAICAELH